MFTKDNRENRKAISFVCIEDLVPKNHLVRDIEAAINFDFIYDEVKSLYSERTGRPSVDPVVLFKLIFVQYMFGIRSMRQTIKECEVNMAYKWFLGYDMLDSVPHFSTFGKNYVRRFADSGIFEKIFEKILAEAIENGFVDDKEIFIDGTHIKANANHKKAINKIVKVESKNYQKQLLQEINEIREENGKKPFDDNDELGEKRTKSSTTDPDCGEFHKGEHQKCFAYTTQTACDKNNFILDYHVTPGNVHDSKAFDRLFEKLSLKFNNIKAIAMDSGYKTPWICKQLYDNNILPVTTYKRPMTKKGFFKKHQYAYDEYYDCYICPNNCVLEYTTTNRDGYKEYKSNKKECINCPYIKQCTESSNNTKVVTRHIWEEYIEKAEDIRHTPYGKELYALRSQTIERVFGDAKEKHNLRYARYRGIKKVTLQVLLTFACMNLKKLAKFKKIKRRYDPEKSLFFSSIAKLMQLIKNSINKQKQLQVFYT